MTTNGSAPSRPTPVATWSTLPDRAPRYALVANVDLVVVRYDDQVSVLYGRCLHRGALLADGRVEGHNLICGVHNWDYRLDSGISEYNNDEALHAFGAWVDATADAVMSTRPRWRRGTRPTRRPTTATRTSASTPTIPARPRSRTTRTSARWPGTA